MTAANLPTLRIGARAYPVVLPSLRDPRLHLAAVIITIHVLGQVALGFAVSVPQILSAILTCAVIEVVLTVRRSGRLVWPASAMLTGSGVALILRSVATEPWDHWTWTDWHIFALVAGLSLATKYLIQYRGSHVFNPSNVGLVAAFVLLGSDRIEPLDFWWGPLDAWLLLAYAVILVGGLLITSRLGLLAMAGTFWMALAAGLGLLAASGHCITAAWSLGPVCGPSFWWVVVTSPEVLIFLFFMITDPKTIPAGGEARVLFAVGIAFAGTALMAPQTTEFGAKVGLLAGLAVMSPLRVLFDRLFGRGRAWARLATAPSGAGGGWRVFGRGAALGAAAVLLPIVIVVAGWPARPTAASAGDPAAALAEAAVDIDPGTLPAVTVADEVSELNADVAGSATELAETLAENLAVEAAARGSSDPSLLRTVSHGPRLIAMERRIEEDAVAKRRVVERYRFDTLRIRPVYGASSQLGASLGFDATGTIERVTTDEAGVETDRVTVPFSATFVLSQATGDRWLIVDEIDPP